MIHRHQMTCAHFVDLADAYALDALDEWSSGPARGTSALGASRRLPRGAGRRARRDRPAGRRLPADGAAAGAVDVDRGAPRPRLRFKQRRMAVTGTCPAPASPAGGAPAQAEHGADRAGDQVAEHGRPAERAADGVSAVTPISRPAADHERVAPQIEVGRAAGPRAGRTPAGRRPAPPDGTAASRRVTGRRSRPRAAPRRSTSAVAAICTAAAPRRMCFASTEISSARCFSSRSGAPPPARRRRLRKRW